MRPRHQIGLPWHWGSTGCTEGDAANGLTRITLDPNVHIQEVKALTADIRPGRWPTGAECAELVRSHQERAGITGSTGTEILSERVPRTPAAASSRRSGGSDR